MEWEKWNKTIFIMFKVINDSDLFTLLSIITKNDKQIFILAQNTTKKRHRKTDAF
jgi:hypothetical protein